MLSCSKCLLPETAEATSFDDHGSCSVCAQIEVRDTQINWDERHAQMLELVAQYRDKGLYDCIVPYSGGMPSTSWPFQPSSRLMISTCFLVSHLM